MEKPPKDTHMAEVISLFGHNDESEKIPATFADFLRGNKDRIEALGQSYRDDFYESLATMQDSDYLDADILMKTLEDYEREQAKNRPIEEVSGMMSRYESAVKEQQSIKQLGERALGLVASSTPEEIAAEEERLAREESKNRHPSAGRPKSNPSVPADAQPIKGRIKRDDGDLPPNVTSVQFGDFAKARGNRYTRAEKKRREIEESQRDDE